MAGLGRLGFTAAVSAPARTRGPSPASRSAARRRAVRSWRSRLLSTSEVTPSRTSTASRSRRVADRLRRLKVKPPAKTASRRKSACSSAGEQVVAPGDRVAHRLLPGGQVARAAGQQRQPPLQPGEQRRRREDLDARGGQLDGQRQAVQAAADLGDRRRRSRRSARSRPCTACARCDEEPHRLGLGHRRSTAGASARCQAAPAAAPRCSRSPRDAEPHPAGDQDFSAGRRPAGRPRAARPRPPARSCPAPAAGACRAGTP